MSMAERFNPKLFQFDPAESYPWLLFPKTTLAIITWDRLEFTKKLLDSLLRYTHLPHDYLIVDNGSTDGTAELLRSFAMDRENVRLVLNRRNLGKVRAMAQIYEAVADGLIVFFDNDVELLSNYWLLHVQKAYYAYSLAYGGTDVAFGIRLINNDEYGFRYALDREVLKIPTAKNALPRTSFAAASKDTPDPDTLLDEAIAVGWSDFLTGNSVISLPVSFFKKMAMRDQFPKYIGGVDSYFSNEVTRLGGRLGYIENGPVARHNDWPYSDAKIAQFEKIVEKRATTDFYYMRWKLKNLWRRLRR